MLVTKQKENTASIVGATDTVLFSECCHSYYGKYILAHSGEKCNRNRIKCESFCCEIVMKETNKNPEVS